MKYPENAKSGNHRLSDVTFGQRVPILCTFLLVSPSLTIVRQLLGSYLIVSDMYNTMVVGISAAKHGLTKTLATGITNISGLSHYIEGTHQSSFACF